MELNRAQMIADLLGGNEEEERQAMIREIMDENPKPDEPWYEDFGEGVVTSLLSTKAGIEDLFGDVEDEDLLQLEDWKRDAAESGWGTVGRVTGELGQLAIPGTAGLKLAAKIPTVIKTGANAGRTLKHAQGLRSATRLAGDVGGAAAHGALRLPEAGESRGGNALSSGGFAMGGQVLGKALRVAGMGVKGKPSAARIRDLGGEPSAGQMNEFLNRIEKFMNLGVIPGSAKAVEKARNASGKSLVRTAQKMADPKNRVFNESRWLEPLKSKQVNKEIKKAFDEGYDVAWGTGAQLQTGTQAAMRGAVTRRINELPGKKQTKNMKDLWKEIEDALQDPDVSVKTIDELLKNMVRGAGNNPGKVRAWNAILKDVRKAMRNGLPNNRKEMLDRLDGKYAHYAALRNAVRTRAATRGTIISDPGQITMPDLLTGQTQAANKYVLGIGDEPYNQFLDDAFEMIGTQQEPLLGTARAILKEIPDIFQTGRLGRRIAGTGLGQRRLRELARDHYPDALRNWYSGARFGAAYED
jgi:hypothetical protein